MTRFIPVLLFSTAIALAQPPNPPVGLFPPELVQYFDLKQDQIDTINRLNATQLRFEFDKNQRMAQVNDEITYWTAQSPIDPSQLGVRYAELEAIRRDIADQRKRTEEQVQAVLTAAQKTKAAALVEARKLAAIASQAECQRLIPAAAPAVNSITGALGGFTFVNPSLLFSSTGCLSAIRFVVPGLP